MTHNFQPIMRHVGQGLLTAVVAFLAIGPTAVLAADARPLNIQTSPLPINLTTLPGGSVSADLRVKQNSGANERLKVSLMKFSAYGDEGKPRLMDREAGDDYFDWVKFDKTSFDAPDNVWQTVKMDIKVPKTGAFGYYYAAVFSRVGDDARQDGGTNAIQGGTAVLVLLDVNSPGAKRDISVTQFSADHKIYEFLPAALSVRLRNGGNVHGIPTGDIFVSRGNSALATLHVNPERGNILPNSNRIYTTAWDDGFPVYKPTLVDGKVKLDKNNKQVSHLEWDLSKLSKFRFGKYTAKLYMVYDDGQRDVPLEGEVSFWVIPWRILLGILAVVALVGFGIFVTLRGTVRGAQRLGRKR